MCDGATYEETLEDLDRVVRRWGWAVQGVEGRRPWAYTIGLAERFGHAELVIAGVEWHLSLHVLNALGMMVATGEVLTPGRDPVAVAETEVAFGEIHMLGNVSSHGSVNGSIPRTIGWLPTGFTFCLMNCFSRACVFMPGTFGLYR